MKNLFILLLFSCSQYHQIAAYDKHLPADYVMSNNDSVNVYNTFMYPSLCMERLEDMKSVPLRLEDRKVLNAMLSCTKRRNGRIYPVLTDGMFVEVKPKSSSVYGVYVNRSKYTIIAENEQSVLSYYTFTIPSKYKVQINTMLSFYHKGHEESSRITRFDSLPAALALHRNMCLFNPNKKTVDATFYVILDSCSHTVLPVTYHISKRKRNIHVSREIPIWERLKYTEREENGTIHVHNSNGVSWNVKEYNNVCNGEDILTEYFPNWQNMSNKERMQTLDRYLE